MNRQEQFEMLKQEYEQIDVPEQALFAVQQGMERAHREKCDRGRWKPLMQITAAAAVMALLIVPNVYPQAALAVADVPVLNKVIDLVILDRFEQEDADNMYAASVMTAKLEAKGDAQLQSSVGEINAEVQNYADMMIAQFQREMEQQGGVYGLDITCNVVTDNDTWFTLQIATTETVASGAETMQYYNLNKATGKYVTLADVFPQDAEYMEAISDDIREQMLHRMETDENAVYYIGDEISEESFYQIAADQNFYFNQDGQLVIVFDEYEVAPGFMGCPEFIIDAEVTEALLEK